MSTTTGVGPASAIDWRSAPILLLETNPLLRRTVVLTARSYFKGEVHEASSTALARGMLKARAYCGMILALDPGPKMQPAYDFSLIDEVRARQTACPDDMPVAVMVERCDADLAQALRRRDVSRIILKPFRARVILELVSEFSGLARRASSA